MSSEGLSSPPPSAQFPDWLDPSRGWYKQPSAFIGEMLDGFHEAGLSVDLDVVLKGMWSYASLGRYIFPVGYAPGVAKSMIEQCIDASPQENLAGAGAYLQELSKIAGTEQPERTGLWQYAASLCSSQAINQELPRFGAPFAPTAPICRETEPLFCQAIQTYTEEPTSSVPAATPITQADGYVLFIQKSHRYGGTTALSTKPIATNVGTKPIVIPPGSIVEVKPWHAREFERTGASVEAISSVYFMRLSRFAFPPEVRDELFSLEDHPVAHLSIDEIHQNIQQAMRKTSVKAG